MATKRREVSLLEKMRTLSYIERVSRGHILLSKQAIYYNCVWSFETFERPGKCRKPKSTWKAIFVAKEGHSESLICLKNKQKAPPHDKKRFALRKLNRQKTVNWSRVIFSDEWEVEIGCGQKHFSLETTRREMNTTFFESRSWSTHVITLFEVPDKHTLKYILASQNHIFFVKSKIFVC